MTRLVESLAGTGRLYVEGQARVRDGKVNIQVAGDQGNRGYGFAQEVEAPIDLRNWLLVQEKPLVSLANSEAHYTPVQLRPRANGEVHIQIAGFTFNREYGASFSVNAPKLNEYLANILE